VTRPRVKIPTGVFDLELEIDGRAVLFVGARVTRIYRGGMDSDGGPELHFGARSVVAAEPEPAKTGRCGRCGWIGPIDGLHMCHPDLRAERDWIGDRHADRYRDVWTKQYQASFDAFFEAVYGRGPRVDPYGPFGKSAREYAPRAARAVTTWRTVLGFGEHETPSLESAKAAYRERITKAHPDAGGEHETAVALNVAWTAAQKECR